MNGDLAQHGNDSPASPDRETGHEVDAELCARRLQKLVRKCDEFFTRQLLRLDQVCSRLTHKAECLVGAEELARTLKDQKEQWEKSKQEQAEQIAEEVEMLSAAWERIESERRALLACQGDFPAESAGTAPAGADILSPVPDYLFETEPAHSGRSAALQFHQIKREISKHVSRHST